MKGFTVDIFTTPLYARCANGGISERVFELTIVEIDDRRLQGTVENPIKKDPQPVAERFQAIEPTESRPAARLVIRNFSGEPYVHVEPLADVPSGETGYMAGGALVHSCDSRWKELAGTPYPVKLHDRTETWKDHRILGR